MANFWSPQKGGTPQCSLHHGAPDQVTYEEIKSWLAKKYHAVQPPQAR
jgi:hypothetical protein